MMKRAHRPRRRGVGKTSRRTTGLAVRVSLSVMLAAGCSSSASHAMVGGEDIEAPFTTETAGFLVSVEAVLADTRTHRCLGALVSRNIVVTAGHCVRDNPVRVRASLANGSPPPALVEAGQWKAHPSWNGGYDGKPYARYRAEEAGRYHDIAVIRLKSGIEGSKPITIAPPEFDPSEVRAISPTYSVFGRAQDGIFVLQEGYRFATFGHAIGVEGSRHWFDASFPSDRTLLCSGDSGSPVTVLAQDEFRMNVEKQFLVGIQVTIIGSPERPRQISAALERWGSGSKIPLCGFRFSFVDIASHARWIEETLSEMAPDEAPGLRFYGD